MNNTSLIEPRVVNLSDENLDELEMDNNMPGIIPLEEPDAELNLSNEQHQSLQKQQSIEDSIDSFNLSGAKSQIFKMATINPEQEDISHMSQLNYTNRSKSQRDGSNTEYKSEHCRISGRSHKGKLERERDECQHDHSIQVNSIDNTSMATTHVVDFVGPTKAKAKGGSKRKKKVHFTDGGDSATTSEDSDTYVVDENYSSEDSAGYYDVK